MKEKKFKMVVTLSTVVMAFTMFALLIVSITQFIRISKLTNKKETMQIQLNYLEQTETAIRNSISDYKKVDFVEDYAREWLGYIKDGDVIYEFE